VVVLPSFAPQKNAKAAMKRSTLSKLECFIRHNLVVKLRNDLKKLRITKEADIECCVYYHLRRTLPANGIWTILARKYLKATNHYVDLLVLRRKRPRLAIEIKWNRKKIHEKDLRSLMRSLKKMRVNKAYYISVGPDISLDSYDKLIKDDSQKYRLHEVLVGLDFHKKEAKAKIKEWKRQRSLLGRNMRLGTAR
jgi:hypothetical protein